VLNFSVDNAWVGNRVGVWLWGWVVKLWNLVFELGIRGIFFFVGVVMVITVSAIISDRSWACPGCWNWEWIPPGSVFVSAFVVEVVMEVLWSSVVLEAKVCVVEGWLVASNWLNSVFVVSTVMVESSVGSLTIILSDSIVPLSKDGSKVEDFGFMRSGIFEVTNIFVELFKSPFDAGSAEISTLVFKCDSRCA
jgi:hypothetical protein